MSCTTCGEFPCEDEPFDCGSYCSNEPCGGGGGSDDSSFGPVTVGGLCLAALAICLIVTRIILICRRCSGANERRVVRTVPRQPLLADSVPVVVAVAEPATAPAVFSGEVTTGTPVSASVSSMPVANAHPIPDSHADALSIPEVEAAARLGAALGQAEADAAQRQDYSRAGLLSNLADKLSEEAGRVAAFAAEERRASQSREYGAASAAAESVRASTEQLRQLSAEAESLLR